MDETEKIMTSVRLKFLLKNARDNFAKCSNPFSPRELYRLHVRSWECIDLSHKIAEIIDEYIETTNWKLLERTEVFEEVVDNNL